MALAIFIWIFVCVACSNNLSMAEEASGSCKADASNAFLQIGLTPTDPADHYADTTHGMAFDGARWRLEGKRPRLGLLAEDLYALEPWTSTEGCVAPPTAISYSQSHEDSLLYNHYFCNVVGGTYVEIGALDGQLFSNTKFFDEHMQWSGVLIEASPSSVKKLLQNRGSNAKNMIVGEAVCPDGVDTVDFMVGPFSAVNGVDSTMPQDLKQQFQVDQHITVPCRSLGAMMNAYLKSNGASHIDLFSLDVEGGELAVLETMDWSVPVHVWVVEMDGLNTSKDEAVRQLLYSHGYITSSLAIDRSEVFEIPR